MDASNEQILAAIENLAQQVKSQQDTIAQLQSDVANIGQGQQGQDDVPSREELFDTLSALHEASDEELAANGLTRAEVDAAVGEYNSAVQAEQGQQDQGEGQYEGAEGNGQYEGSYGGEGEGQAAAAMGGEGTAATTFRALSRELVQLKSAFKAREFAEKRANEEIQFSEVNENINTLVGQRDAAIELAERVIVENEALNLCVRTGTRPVRPGQDNGERLFHAPNGDLHPFQARIKTIKTEKNCTEGAAIQFASKENPALHADWVQSQSL